MKTIRVSLYNRSAYFKSEVSDEVKEAFKYFVPRYKFMPKYQSGLWDGKISLIRRNKCFAGAFVALKDNVEKETGCRFKVADYREPLKFRKIAASDRVFQNECIAAMKAEMSGGLVLNATGTGKTKCAGLYFKSLVGTGCFIVDELTLMDQAIKDLEEDIGEKVGMIGNSVFNPQRITVATIQTLDRHKKKQAFLKWGTKLDVVILDEVHVALAKRNVSVIGVMKPKVVFGLTATLELNKKDIRMRAYNLAGPVIYEYGYSKGLNEGYLSPGVVIAVKVPQNRDDYVYEAKDYSYQDDYRDFIVESEIRNLLIADITEEAWRRGHHVVVIVERVRHLKTMSAMLDKIPHATVDGEKTVIERVGAKNDFESGDMRLLITNKVFKKGINIKAIDVIVEGSGLKSKNDARQKFGRGVRLLKGKTGLLYFDISDRENRFERAAKSRLAAFKKQGIPTFRTSSSDASDVLDLAERKLNRLTSQKVLL